MGFSWRSSQQTLLIPEFQAAVQAIEGIIREQSKTFYFATGLLPRQQRQAIRALYAFCRMTDDLVDSDQSSLEELEHWRSEAALEVENQKNPVLFTWAYYRKQYRVNLRYQMELIDGVRMDLEQKTYPTWDALQAYCYRVASTVGLLSMPIIGLAKGATFEQAELYAIKLGIALQLTNILRDVGEDAARGRVYFPEEDLQRFGLTVQDILNHTCDDRFVQLMQYEIERARKLYQEALPGITFLSSSARISVGAAALLYAAILEEIEKIRYRVYDQRAYTTGLKKISLLPAISLSVLFLRKPKSISNDAKNH